MDASTLGLRIRKLRTVRHLTQRQLADFAGRSERWLWSLERGDGRSRLDIAAAQGIAFGLQLDVAVVLGLRPVPDGLNSLNEDDVKRRTFLFRTIGGSLGGSLVPSIRIANPELWERLARGGLSIDNR